MEQNQFEFKPFDKVLVRDVTDANWTVNLFSHMQNKDLPYACVCSTWRYCIPYNEETAHLVGTNKPYEKPEPKEWYIDSRDGLEKYDFTNEEFAQFLNNTVVKNKDITDFRVRYVPNN